MLRVTPATEQDLPALADLFAEMDRFYGATEVASSDRRQGEMKACLFSAQPVAHVLLASAGDDPAGFASYSFLWPAAGLTPSLFLKELYVAEQHRRVGVGRALMQRLLEVAAGTGCSRVEWMTEHGNADARAFYAKLGYVPNAEKVFYRLQGEGFAG